MEANELMQRLKSDKPPTVVDVRSKIEFRRGHIPGAIHMPMWKILFRLVNLPQDKNTEVVLTCEHGPRAQVVRGLLTKRGYINLFLLDGHMAGWRRAGLKTDK
ncbi:rhodanese-like domain-containing protein [Malonomonas rubra]|uniref:rhodanese-like domain-containing protein n=1 Tax=Malonomonas rubra TaxID=57040 RepID=UPI0026F1C6B2|nr:rhodanese-like domain-containing protein [Malonomonas rubra]